MEPKTIEIRGAQIGDLAGIKYLTTPLGGPGIETLTRKKMIHMLAHPDYRLLVFLKAGEVGGFLSLHFLPEAGAKGGFAAIGYIAVNPFIRSRPVGKELEEYARALAIRQRAERMIAQLPPPKSKAYTFYQEQGYSPSADFFIKNLNDI